jgi:hypothetical protein
MKESNMIMIKLFSKAGALLFTHVTKGTTPLEVGYKFGEYPFFDKHITEWGCNMTLEYL